MISLKDELWLKKALTECFDTGSKRLNSDKDLKGFRILLVSLIKHIEGEVDETQALWQKNSESKELEGKFCSLERSLFHLRRFCEQQNRDA